MKTLVLLFTFMTSMVITVSAQSLMDKLFERYSGKEGYTSVSISKEMFDMMAQVNITTSEKKDQKKLDEMKDFVSKIESLRVISSGSKEGTPADQRASALYREIMDNMPKNTYKQLMEVKEGEQLVTFYVKRTGAKVAELIVVAREKNETSLISLAGDIDLNKVSELTKGMNIKGLDKLGNAGEESK